ncbi:MAG TPA: ChaN family lipoprotein [Vicinamibacterales bacterium]|jgi:uncharacterized iron-regulated protein
MQKPSLLRLVVLVLLAVTLGAPVVRASDKILHLAIGDPARKDREAPLVLDAITDTKTGEAVTPAELATRLAGTRLLLVGEEHTNSEFHRAQLRVIDALHRAGRHVLIGLEMYPYTEQRFLDEWREGYLTEEGFLRLSRWYDNWGYAWDYYRDIFLFARDQRIPMFAINTPREIVAAVRKKGLANLTPEEAAHIPKDIDVDSADHLMFFKTTFEGEMGPVHGEGMPDEMLKNMLSAQATWDATMGFNAVEALKRANDPKAIMVVMVGSGHVAYGVGIERQARKWFEGTISTIIPVPVSADKDGRTTSTRASYANFTWGVPDQIDSDLPMLGTSTAVGQGDTSRRVIIVQKDSPGDKAGFKVGDVMLSLDGAPLTDKETYNRQMAAKRWGDEAVFVVKRGAETVTLRVVFRRTPR